MLGLKSVVIKAATAAMLPTPLIYIVTCTGPCNLVWHMAQNNVQTHMLLNCRIDVEEEHVLIYRLSGTG